jgi:L-fucose isomerase-like protein
MSALADTKRHLAGAVEPWLTRPVVRLQPLVATVGTPNIDLAALAKQVEGVAVVLPPIAIRSAAHWTKTVLGLGKDVDAILPVSITSYPTEWWNSHPEPLVKRGLPFIFWPIIAYDEPDFWRWSATDMLKTVGVETHLVENTRAGLALLRALGMRRMLKGSKIVVFGGQNFPWNAHAAGRFVTESLGTIIVVRSIDDIRRRADNVSDAAVREYWAARKARYVERGVKPEELATAIRTTLAIREILRKERALGFGLNCFGDLIPKGGRDVPCLAQTLLREEGYIASCDGDFLAMMSMVLTSCFLDKPCMMSNMYPVKYVGALTDHFGGNPLSPGRRYPRAEWRNLARLGHCGFVGVVSPEMSPEGKVELKDWGGTWEIKRDGRGCGNAGRLAAGERITVIELKFDGKTLLVADGEVCETTEHKGMPHCERTALLRFRDLEGFVANISREHTVVVYGDHIPEFRILARTLGLTMKEF